MQGRQNTNPAHNKNSKHTAYWFSTEAAWTSSQQYFITDVASPYSLACTMQSQLQEQFFTPFTTASRSDMLEREPSIANDVTLQMLGNDAMKSVLSFTLLW